MIDYRKKTVNDVAFRGKRALVRVDFNVPLKSGRVADDTRIAASLPTLQHILADGGSLVLMSHLGRPKGKKNPELSLAPVAARLSELLGRPVEFVPDCVGDAVTARARALKAGSVMLLENLRFYAEEEKNDPGFSKQLAALGDVFVCDAFGTVHRAHASTAGLPALIKPAVAGLLLEKELHFLGSCMANPKRPLVAVLGGAKVSSKLSVLTSLIKQVDALLIGGAMAYTFLLARGGRVGASLVEPDLVADAKKILEIATARKVRLELPADVRAVRGFDHPETLQIVDAMTVPDGMEGIDIGPKTLDRYIGALTGAKTVFWNGPLGAFETPAYSEGTFGFAKALGACDAVSIVGGGDSAAAVVAAHIADRIDHISTGGGASLEFIEGRELPGVAALDDR